MDLDLNILKKFGHILMRKDFFVIDNVGFNDIIVYYKNMTSFEIMKNGDLCISLLKDRLTLFDGGGYRIENI